MSPRYLLDTNICIYFQQKRSPELLERFRKLQPGDASLSVITYGELLYGAEKSQHRVRAIEYLEHIVSLLPVISLPEDAAATYGQIRAELESRGELIGGNDLWIAAHAKCAGLTLVTNNEREFRRVGGLRVENWTARKS